MSIAVAVRKAGAIALTTDSQTNLGGERVPAVNMSGPKFVAIGDAYMAATGWTLYSNIFEDVLTRRRATPRLDTELRIFSFFNELWELLHDRYSFVKDQADESDSPFGSLDSTFLVVSRNGIFSVSTDLSVLRYERYFAIGSGAQVAMGAVHALYETDIDGVEIAERAASAAVDHDVYCGLPLHTVSVTEPRRRAKKKAARRR